MKRKITQQQLENIQIDYGMVYVNFGVDGERRIGPTRGGGEFNATATIRDIEYDGSRGKTKGMQHVDDINAMLKVTNLDTSMGELALAMPYATYAEEKITCKGTNLGVIPDSAYLENITMFAKVVGGGYKKITLYNAMAENDFVFAAVPKGEGQIAVEVYAHWDAQEDDDTANLYEIEDVASMGDDVAKPTATTVPDDTDTGVAVGSNLTATFSEDIRQTDINTNNFILIKATDGSIVPGTLTYTLATKTATFSPASNLDAETAYIWTIARVRDIAGNMMDPVAVNFTTA